MIYYGIYTYLGLSNGRRHGRPYRPLILSSSRWKLLGPGSLFVASNTTNMGVSINGGCPQITYFHGMFLHKPSMWGELHLWNPPYYKWQRCADVHLHIFMGIHSSWAVASQGLGRKRWENHHRGSSDVALGSWCHCVVLEDVHKTPQTTRADWRFVFLKSDCALICCSSDWLCGFKPQASRHVKPWFGSMIFGWQSR